MPFAAVSYKTDWLLFNSETGELWKGDASLAPSFKAACESFPRIDTPAQGEKLFKVVKAKATPMTQADAVRTLKADDAFLKPYLLVALLAARPWHGA
jgi:hypothetical protein